MEQYEIQKQIGTGSFGDVFLARHRKTNKILVIKKIKIKGITAKEKENIETQIKVLRDLKHVNIVSYKDSFLDSEGVLNIVMQYCQEGDMHNKIRQGKKFDEQQVLDWTIQMCLAIYLMHERRILHRDLKTQNIFLANSRIRLGDFGISKVLDSTVQLTSTVIGTPYYMSPQLFNHRPYSYKTDIWALGCVIYEICSSRHAFDADNLNALARKVVNGSFPPLPSHYSKGLRELVKKMLSVNPKDRPTVVQILKSPVLKRRLQNYMMECLSEEPNDDNHLQTLIEQAQKLGINLKQHENPSSHYESHSQPHNPSTVQSIQRSSSKQNKMALIRNESVEKLQKQRAVSRDESRREKTRIQEENKKIEERKAIEKRNQLLEREREKRRRMVSQERNRKNVSSQKKLSRQESLPLLIQTESKRRIESSNVSTTSRGQTKLPEIASHSGSYNILPPPTVQTPKVTSPVQIASQSSSPMDSKPSKKPFKMEEEYDMNFEQDDEDYQPVIEQKHEEEQQAETNNKLLNEYPQVFDESVGKKVQDSPKKKVTKEPIKEPIKEPLKQPVKDQPKLRTSEPIFKQQPIQHKKSQVLEHKKSEPVQSKKPQLTDHRRSSMNPTRTQLQYSVSGSEWTPSRRELPSAKVEQKTANPKYVRLMDRISQLRKKVELGMTKQQYSDMHKLLKNQQKLDQQAVYAKVLNIIDMKMIGMWHVIDKIVELETVLEQLPAYQ